MTTKQTFSKLAIAFTALLAAAVPCFSQTRTAESAVDTANVVARTSNDSVLDFNSIVAGFNTDHSTAKASATSPAIKLTSPKTANSRPDLSLAKFMNAGNQSTLVQNSTFTAPRATIYDSRVTIPAKHFNADEYAGSAPRKAVTFVPSRGQKLPDSEIVAW